MRKRVMLALLLTVILIISGVQSVSASEEVLKLGSKGIDVKELQQKLVEDGYLDKKYITGFFGPQTRDAVKKFQKDNGINQTGAVAEKTTEALYTEKKLDSTMVFRNGDESIYVKVLQQALCNAGYLEAKNVTGYFGDVTEAAVKKFQKKNGISETGVAAELTIKQLDKLINGTKLETGKVYKSGDEGAGVKSLQNRLSELGYLDEKYVTGYFGAITVSAVKKFQKNNQISETGTVAELTLAKLNSAEVKVNTETEDKTGISESIAKPGTLRYGDRGAQVKTLQNNLKKLKYFSGEATGEFGSVTKQAVIKFQKAYSLTADGIAGAKTLAKISAALSGKATASSSSGSTSSSASKPSTTGPSASQSANTGVTVSGYTSANMDVVNAFLETATDEQKADVKLIAQIIKREVGGKSYKTQLGVGSVIMNRVARNGMTVRAVIFSKNQFSTANSSLERETYSTSNYYAAIEAYMGVKPIGNCLYFCSKSVRYSCWAGRNRTFYTMIDNECFFL